jgi:uncharacterized membrane protein YfcA
MLDLLSSVLTLNGVGWIACSAFVAGTVRGFAGFGTAMIFLPVAGMFVSPVAAISALFIMDLIGPAPVIPQKFRAADKPDLARLVFGAALVFPAAIWLLLSFDPAVFRYSVSILSLVMLIALVSGLRIKTRLSPKYVWGIGGTAGFCGGFAGVPGPPVIFFYMASDRPAAVTRATNSCFLYGFDIMATTVLIVMGSTQPQALMMGALMAVPNVIGNFVGAAIFNPEKEKLYRNVAYAIIAISALSGLPIWES